MIVILAALAGGLWGGYLAKKRGGNAKDIAQYAGGYGILFAILGLFATIYLSRALA